MKYSNRFIQLNTIKGDVIHHDGANVTPVSQALVIRFPFGGFVWNRPVAIQLEEGNGTRQIPITDATLFVQMIIVITGFLLAMLYWLVGRKFRK